MQAPSPTRSFTHPKLVHGVTDLLCCLKTQSKDVSAVWDSIPFADMKSNGGGSDIKGGTRAVEQLSLAFAELAKCGDLKSSWASLTLAKLAEQLEVPGSTPREGASIEELREGVQSLLDGLSSREVEELTDGFGGLGMDDKLEAMLAGALEAIEDSGVVELPAVPKEKSPEETWQELRVGFKKLNHPMVAAIIGRETAPVLEAVMLLEFILKLQSAQPEGPVEMDTVIDQIVAMSGEDRAKVEKELSDPAIRKSVMDMVSPFSNCSGFLASPKGKQWRSELMDCVWKLLDEAHFPNLRKVCEEQLKSPSEKNHWAVMAKIIEAVQEARQLVAEQAKGRAELLINDRHEFKAEDLPLVLKLRGAAVMAAEVKEMQGQIALMQMAVGMEVDSSPFDELKVRVEPLISAAQAAGLIRAERDVAKVSKDAMWVAELMIEKLGGIAKIDEAANREVELKALAAMEKLKSNFSNPSPKNLIQVLQVLHDYNQTYYYRGREPWMFIPALMQAGDLSMPGAAQAWFKGYVEQLRIRINPKGGV